MPDIALTEYPSGATAIDVQNGGLYGATPGDHSVLAPSSLPTGNPIFINERIPDVGDLDADSSDVQVFCWVAPFACTLHWLELNPDDLAVAAGETVELEIHKLTALQGASDIATGNRIGAAALEIDENATAPIVLAFNDVPEGERRFARGEQLWFAIDGYHDAQSGPNTLGNINVVGYAYPEAIAP